MSDNERETDAELLAERAAGARRRTEETLSETCVPEPFRDFFRKTAEFMLSVRKPEENETLSELSALNLSMYADILPDHYDMSYANPEYAADRLGEAYGPLLAAVYAELRGLIPAVYEDDTEGQAVLFELYLELYSEFEEEPPKAETVRRIFGDYIRDYAESYLMERIRAQVDPAKNFAVRIIERSDPADLRYLYSYGEYVSKETLETARFIGSLPEEEIARAAGTFTEGYRLGFVHAHKDLSKKGTVQLVYELGFERIMKRAVENFRGMSLETTAERAPVRLISRGPNRHNGYTGAVPNLQFDYDHREDLALVLDERFISMRKRLQQECFEAVRQLARRHAGPAVQEAFGREPFEPAAHAHAIRMSEAQLPAFIDMKTELRAITQRYIPGNERSFTIMDFPVPDVGPRFPEIFEDTLRVNTLDSEKYGEIQQYLIDALDKGSYVKVTGRNGNETDLVIALHELSDPDTQTNFENCVADVNIPVGEVFTSPRLRGTGGLLHVRRVFLEGYEFRDLKITLRDGYIESADCGNFEDPEENRRYIDENILFHHPTLTIGEFAIGTNTTAYVMARKYGIEAKMPILIAEKTGPHFAMGDTCYSFEEDNRVFNPDGKEIIARDNEHTLVRKTDPSKAYYGCHTDITIPYDELGGITVLTEDGEKIELIRDGRFVLPGTEVLNTPLDEAAAKES
ncbi:MAG: aminopeptidase [Eubacteriales bacterium]|jgi:aminopeptidase